MKLRPDQVKWFISNNVKIISMSDYYIKRPCYGSVNIRRLVDKINRVKKITTLLIITNKEIKNKQLIQAIKFSLYYFKWN